MKRKFPSTVKRLKNNGKVNSSGNGRFDLLKGKTKNELINLFSQQSEIRNRNDIANRLGLSFNNDARDTYKALGYPKDIVFDQYWGFYSRYDIAKRVVDLPANACWQKPPEIKEDQNGEDETEFEKQWSDIEKENKVWHFMSRIDRLSGIGEFGILLLGFDGNAELEMPVESATRLLYIRPYKQNRVTIQKFVEDLSDKRYGLPEIYSLKVTNSNGGTVETLVHWSRIIHIADELTEDDIYGTPRLKNVYNLIAGLHLVSGGSGEMWWRGAFPGLAFILDSEAELDPTQGLTDLNNEINDYIHDLNRTMRLQGMDVKNLAPQVADPSNHVEVLLTLIAAARGIPKRIFMGSERGELASGQDQTAWNKSTRERQTNYCGPQIVRLFVDRLIMVGILVKPKNGYLVNFPDITVPTEEEETKVAKTKSETLATYGNSSGAQEIVPPSIFLKHVMKFDDEVIEQIDKTLQQTMDDDIEDEKAQEEARKEIEAELIAEAKGIRKREDDIAKSLGEI